MLTAYEVVSSFPERAPLPVAAEMIFADRQVHG
jgi:hypothetical protein